jgi:hypothetical protein
MLVIATVLYAANYLLEVLQMAYFADLSVGSQLAYPWLYLVVVGVLKLPLVLAFVGFVHWLGMIEPGDRQRLKEFLLKMKQRVAPGTAD